MNKGFFVVFLAIVLGAMALVFFNQTSNPTPIASVTQPAASAGGASPAPEAAPPVAPEPAGPEAAAPVPVPPPATPEPVKPDQAPPVPVTPEPAQPEPVKPESVPSAPPPPEPVKPQPAVVRPEVVRPEPAQPVTVQPEAPAPAGQTRKSLTLRNIGLHFRENGMVLRIEADRPFSYKTFALPKPDRYVVDLVGVWDNMRAPSVPSNMSIKGVRAGRQAGGPRLVLDMQRAPRKHNVAWASPNVLEIYIE